MKEKSKTTKITLSPVRVLTPNGYSHGLVTKRKATTQEVRHVMKNIFGIVINTREDMYDDEEYREYNKELTDTFNGWLNGETNDKAIMNYASDCSDEPIGLFNAFKLAEYLQKKGII